MFRQEVIDSLTRGYIEKLECDCLILEINSSRYAYNMSLQEVNYNVILAMLNIIQVNSTKSNMSIMKCFEEVLKTFRQIIDNYIKGMDAMIDCLKAIEVRYLLYSYLKFKKSYFLFFIDNFFVFRIVVSMSS